MISRIFVGLVSIFLLISVANAAADDFIVTQQIGFDLIAPSVPGSLTATPVAISQIDLAWASSTDNVAVTGYNVFRDGVDIATTTLISYSDTGLTASTTYTYYVRAFDAAGNYSATSTSVATTTLATTTPPATSTPPTGGGGGEKVELQPLPLEIVTLEIIPATTSVTIKWKTQGFTKSVLRWGRTSSYELGSLAERVFSKEHQTIIDNLDPDTVYQFTIEAENKVGVYGVLTTDTFKTLPGLDVFPPANVSNLVAWRDGSDVVLSWENPADVDFEKVRVLGSGLFYPSDTADGAFIYEGSGNGIRDEDVAIPGTTRYYTVFTYDVRGNISSGAIVALRIAEDGVIIVDPGEDTDVAAPDPDDRILIDLDDVVFMQDGETLDVVRDTVEIDGTKQLTLSIPYERLPEHLKSIVVTVYRDESKTEQFSFLLRADEEKIGYATILAPFGVSGRFPVAVSIFDFETEKVGSADGFLVSEIVFMPASNVSELKDSRLFGFLAKIDYLPFFILFLILLLIVAYRFIRGAA